MSTFVHKALIALLAMLASAGTVGPSPEAVVNNAGAWPPAWEKMPA